MDAHPSLRAPRRSAALLIAAIALTSCAAPAPASEAPATSDAHGVGGGGAAEVAAPARALVVTGEDGAATLIDLATDERTTLAEGRNDITSVQSDGRLLYLASGSDTGDRTSIDVIDTARWTVPHGDHSHSFRGEPRLLGTLEGDGVPFVTAGGQRSALQFDGETVVIAHEEIGDGLDAAPRLSIGVSGPVVPFAGHLLMPSEATILVAGEDGTPVPDSGIPCTDPTDADITRVGAVYSCAEGAVLFTREVGGAVVGESIPYPAGAVPATHLSGRADRPDLARVSANGAWLLDVRQRTWTPLASDLPLVRAAAVGDDDGRTIAIDASGSVRILGADGALLARTEPLVAASLADPASAERVRLIVDGRYAYISDPASGTVRELDHLDDLRLTRTFTDLDPWFVQLVG